MKLTGIATNTLNKYESNMFDFGQPLQKPLPHPIAPCINYGQPVAAIVASTVASCIHDISLSSVCTVAHSAIWLSRRQFNVTVGDVRSEF
jgi:hypothetical protein